jgi:hypothetical protein
VSILGRYAQIIQAHVSLEEQRLQIRYSQLYDFDNCSQLQMDLFLRWILSDSILEPKFKPEDEETAGSPFGDSGPHATLGDSEPAEDSKGNNAMKAVSAKGETFMPSVSLMES